VRNINKIFGLVFLVLFTVSSVFAADVKSESWIEKIKRKFSKKETAVGPKSGKAEAASVGLPSNKEKAVKKIRKDMTDGELVADITNALKRDESILGMVPGLAKSKDPQGMSFYVYNGSKLTDLDRKTLEIVSGRVRNQALIKNTDAINRQLDTARRSQPRSFVPPKIPPRVPSVQSIPSVPSVPSVPRTTPRPPSVPPAPPRR